MEINDSVRIVSGMHVDVIGIIVEINGSDWFMVQLPDEEIIGYNVDEIELA